MLNTQAYQSVGRYIEIIEDGVGGLSPRSPTSLDLSLAFHVIIIYSERESKDKGVISLKVFSLSMYH